MREEWIHDLSMAYLGHHFDVKKTPREIAVLYREIFSEIMEVLCGEDGDISLDAMGFALLHRCDGKSPAECADHAEAIRRLLDAGYLVEDGEKYRVTARGKAAMHRLLQSRGGKTN